MRNPPGRAKGRRRSDDRLVNRRSDGLKILIVCEGERTEPNYSKKFPVGPNTIDVRGVGDNTVFLVRQAVAIKDAEGPFDAVWCVFDRDSFPANYFNQALTLARQNGIEVAYSNEAFELWYVLHFDYLDTGVGREQYRQRLTDLRGKYYEKNDAGIYAELLDRQPTAIRNATRLLEQYDPPNPERDKPSTTVHLLVQALNAYLPPATP